MVEAISLAALFALIVWLIDPLLGSLLHGLVGYLVARLIPSAEPRSLRGDWVTSFLRDNQKLTEHARVKQLFHRVWGKIRLSAPDRTYNFRGSIRGDVLVATYELEGHPETMDRGSFTLKLNNAGNKMVGRHSWTEDNTALVTSDEYEWNRIPTP